MQAQWVEMRGEGGGGGGEEEGERFDLTHCTNTGRTLRICATMSFSCALLTPLNNSGHRSSAARSAEAVTYVCMEMHACKTRRRAQITGPGLHALLHT